MLERIIRTSSKPGDIILDPFSGCGTAIVVAHRLGRRWVGVDVSPTACKLIKKRRNPLQQKMEMHGLHLTLEQLKLHHFEFQNWVFDALHGRVYPKVGDYGIDCWTELNVPTQVKQFYGVGRPAVDNMETAIERFYGFTKETRGVLVGFSFSKDAVEEAARARLKKGMDIKLLTVKEIIDMT